MNSTYLKKKKPKAQSIGWILKNHNLLPRPENISKDSISRRRLYTINKSEFLDMLRRFNYDDIYHNLTFESFESFESFDKMKEKKETKETKVRSDIKKSS